MRTFAALLLLGVLLNGNVARGAENETGRIRVNAEDDEAEHDQFTEPGEYAQPAWAERARMSASTSVFVLSPFEMFAGLLWQTNVRHHGRARHEFVQELDFGLPHRFELGIENEAGTIGTNAHETGITLEARYAFANWNTIPLNPAISLEYVHGFGPSVRATDDTKRGRNRLRRQPDAIAIRALFGQNFGDRIAYGVNVSFLQEVSRDHGSEFEFNQSLSYGVMKGRFELGAEMRYVHRLERHSRDIDELLIGPDFAWKPTRQLRIGIAPLFGCTQDSPSTSVSALISYEFGGAESIVEPIAASR